MPEFNIEDRVRAIPVHRHWLGTGEGTVIGTASSAALTWIQVHFDSGSTLNVLDTEIEKINK